jgi:ABC-type antimicrobial peptide transport system permease subunit
VNQVLNSAIALVTFVVLLISTAGTYALMSFTVARRTREIGIMSALGADRRRIIQGVFSRAILQIGGGVLVGGSISAYLLMFQLVPPGQPVWAALRLLFEAAAGLFVVGLIACGVPMARALRVEPTEALREVG